MARRILLVGGTGLVGGLLAARLCRAGELEIHALLRRPAGRCDPAWHEHVAPPAEWPGIARGIAAEVAVSALGTTMRAAGSQAAFRAVDFDMVVDVARAARAGGTRRMIVISSVGADAGSRNFYLRIKGEMEQALEGLGFDRLDIVRPGLLRGRRGADRRLGERLGILVSPVVNLFLRGRLDRFRAVDGATVAAALAALVQSDEPGRRIHHNRELRRLARG
jgi:uncharacterized protein YbjT (DUF2867 family)